MVTSSVTLDSPSMTLSETRIDKFCQSLFAPITPSNRQPDAATPLLGTLAAAFLASAFACTFPMLGSWWCKSELHQGALPQLREHFWPGRAICLLSGR